MNTTAICDLTDSQLLSRLIEIRRALVEDGARVRAGELSTYDPAWKRRDERNLARLCVVACRRGLTPA